jgi:hypothetical protein
MTKKFFLRRKGFWLGILKFLALAYIALMLFIQIPELKYDFGPDVPVEISGPQDLTRERFPRATFVSIAGAADFDKAYIYPRYGLNYTYFIIEPYGRRLVARTYERVTDEWKSYDRFVGKLRPFHRQPFSYRIRQIYRDRFQTEIPRDAFFLALYDVPKPSAWQIGAVILAGVLGIALIYLFFFFKRFRRGRALSHKNQEHPSGDSP